MAAVRHLEPIADDFGPRPRPRHLRLVEPDLRAELARQRQLAVYRRRRLVVGVVVTLVLLGGTRALPTAPAAAGPVPVPTPDPVVTYVVQPGDSYWSIAASLDRPGDVRKTVDELVAVNGDRGLQAGDRLTIPG